MKIAAAIISTISALSWPGQSEQDPCGTQVNFPDQSINATCTLDTAGRSPWRVFLGGEYIVGPNQFTNFEGLGSESIDVVIFWEQTFDSEGVLDNSTCGLDTDVTVSCVDNGAASTGVYFQETANDFRMAKTSNYNFQIKGAVDGDVLTIALVDGAGKTSFLQHKMINFLQFLNKIRLTQYIFK